jgi:hypothetical protein
MAIPKFTLPNINKENSKMSFEKLIGKKMTQPVKFMGEDMKIAKLSVAQILLVQAAAKAAEADENKGFDILKTIIRASAEGASALTDDEFADFPMDELSKLSNEIMVFSGIDAGKSK